VLRSCEENEFGEGGDEANLMVFSG
jgi:hypothetical protein